MNRDFPVIVALVLNVPVQACYPLGDPLQKLLNYLRHVFKISCLDL